MNEDVLNLIIKAQNLASGAFKDVERDLGGLGGASKGATKDVEALAGSGSSKGGLGGLMSGLTGLINPAMLAAGAVAGLTAVAGAAYATYKTDEVQIKALNTALIDHHISVDGMTAAIEANKGSYEALGFTVEDTRVAFTKMTEAGLSQSQQMTAMTPIMDLARAKNLSLSDATELYTKAMMGSAKGLKDLGIILPSVSAASADVDKQTAALTVDHTKLKDAQAALIVVEDSLRGKHTLTAAEALKLELAHEKVTAATDKVTKAQAALTLAQQGGVDKGARLTTINADLTKAIGDQSKSIDANAPIMAKLSDDWNHFAEVVGPLVETAFSDLLKGLSAVVDFISSDVVPAVETVIADIQGIVGAVGKAVDAIANSPIGKVAGFVGGAAGTVAGDIGTTVGDLAHGNVVGALGANPFVQAGQNLVGGVTSLIPHFDQGGIMPGATGQPGLAVLHGGESVTPKGGAGVNVNVTISGAAIFDPYGAGAQQIATALLPGIRRALNASGMTLA